MNSKESYIYSAPPKSYITGVHPKPTYISAAKPRETYISAMPSPPRLRPLTDAEKRQMQKAGAIAYNTSTKSGKFVQDMGGVLQDITEDIDKKVARLAVVNQYVTDNSKLGLRKLREQMLKANKVVRHIRLNGAGASLDQFRGVLNRNNLMNFMNSAFQLIGKSKFFVTVKKISSALKPIVDFLNKIPGFKYLGAIEKLVKATCQMFKGHFDIAFGLYLDGLREIIESLLVDAAIAALIASGFGLLAILLVVIVFIVDYFLFSDNSGDSLVDKYTPLSTTNLVQDHAAPAMYHAIYK